MHTLDDNCLFEFCKFRTLNHKLPIEYGRWHNITRNMRFCNLCNQNEIGDECHYMLECNIFEQYSKRLYWHLLYKASKCNTIRPFNENKK